MNKKNFIITITLVIIFTIIIFVILNNPFNHHNKQKEQVKAYPENLCEATSLAQCISKLDRCQQYNTIKDYLIDQKIEENGDDWPDKWLTQVEHNINTYIPEAYLYKYHQPQKSPKAFIKINTTYCPINETNLKIMFSPLKTKAEALEYFSLVKNDLVSAINKSIIITQPEDFESDQIICNLDYQKYLNHRVSDVIEQENGYLLDLIIHNRTYLANFSNRQIIVKYDGSFEQIKTEMLVDCGPGIEL